MKVACLYYGQPRFVHNPYCIESHKKFIFDRYDTDVYAHLWWDKELVEWEFSNWGQMDEAPNTPDGLDVFLEKWKPLKYEAEKPIDFHNEKMWNEVQRRFDTNRFTQRKLHHALSQLYSIQKVTEMVDDINKYDFIITIRSDINIWDYPDLNSLPRNKFYLSGHAKFPDLGFIFPPRFKRILQSYDHCEKNLVNWDLVDAPVGEYFKYSCFKRNYSESDLLRGPLPLRVVRGVNCKGPTW